jgi:hypothetical protein
MRRGLLLAGLGLGGLALTLGLTLAAFAFTGEDLGTPANPLVSPSQRQHEGPEQTPSARPERTPSETPTASASDDHGGQGIEPNDDHGGSDSGSGSSGSGSGSSGSGSDDHGGDD